MELVAAVFGLVLLSLPLGGGLFTLGLGVALRRDAGAWAVESCALTTIGSVLTLLGLLAMLMVYGVSQT